MPIPLGPAVAWLRQFRNETPFSPFLIWFGGSTLFGVMVSIPIFYGDLAATALGVNLAQESAWLQWWNDVSARSMFNGQSPGAQDLTYAAAILLVVAHLASLRPGLSRSWAQIRLWTGYYLSCLLLFLVFNRGMKALIGRVRPLDVLRGDQDYSPLWLFGTYSLSEAASKGSFPSGHTTTAMFLLPLTFLLLHSSRRFLAWPVFALALSWGALVGAGRVFRGSHYPGDVLWAMIVCLWISAYAAYHLFGLDRREQSPSLPNCWELRLTAWSAMAMFALFAAVIGIKQMIFEPAWYWPLVTVISALLAWKSTNKTDCLTRF